MKYLHYLCILLCLSHFCISQNTEYSRRIITALASEAFHGRGCVNEGDKKAGTFIKKEMEESGLLKFGNNYFQTFNISVNTIRSKILLQINRTFLKPGTDFVIDGSSPSCKGIYGIARIDKNILKNHEKLQSFFCQDFSGGYLLVDMKGIENKETIEKMDAIIKLNLFMARGIIVITDDEPAFNVSGYVRKSPVIYIKRDKLPEDADLININFENHFFEHYETQNITGYLKGQRDEYIVLAAHYDHLGRMGARTYFPGANDNACGTAMLLDLAKYYQKSKTVPLNSIIFLHLGAEELRMAGASYFLTNPPVSLDKIKMVINLDETGTGKYGLKVINGTVFRKAFNFLTNINKKNKYLAKVIAYPECNRYSHYSFYKKEIPAVTFMTMNTLSSRHTVKDTPELLPMTAYAGTFKLIRDFVEQYN